MALQILRWVTIFVLNSHCLHKNKAHILDIKSAFANKSFYNFPTDEFEFGIHGLKIGFREIVPRHLMMRIEYPFINEVLPTSQSQFVSSGIEPSSFEVKIPN